MNWDELQADFQRGGKPIAPGEIRRFRRHERRKAAQEVIAAAALVAWYGVLLSRSPPPALVAVAIASLLFVGIHLTYLFMTRSELLRASAADTAGWLELLRKKVDADLRWNRFIRGVCITAFVFGLVWAPWMFFTFESGYRAQWWRAAIGFGGYFALVLFMYAWCRRKARLLQARRERLLADR